MHLELGAKLAAQTTAVVEAVTGQLESTEGVGLGRDHRALSLAAGLASELARGHDLASGEDVILHVL